MKATSDNYSDAEQLVARALSRKILSKRGGRLSTAEQTAVDDVMRSWSCGTDLIDEDSPEIVWRGRERRNGRS